MKSNLSKKLLLSLTFVLGGCSTLSGSHPDKLSPAKKAIQTNNAQKEETKLLDAFDSEDDPDAAIGFLETGRYEQFMGHLDTSQAKYEKATNFVAKSKAEALIRVRNLVANTQAMLSSDKERYYYIPDYEITFLYSYTALNYLVDNNLEDAAVSIRNLSYAQYATMEAQEYGKDIQDKNKKDFSYVDSSDVMSRITNASGYKDLKHVSSRVANSYENAFGYYLESIIYQAYDNDLNNARLSMENAARIVPANPYVQRDYEKMQKAFDGDKLYDDNSGKVVVIYEQGFVDSIRKFDVPIVLFFQFVGMQKVSLPYYKKYTLEPPAKVKLYKDDELVDDNRTSILVDTTAMAAKSLSESYNAIVSREVLRLITKASISAAMIQASGDYKGLTMIGTSAYNALTTIADQRSWNLLPNNVQLYSKELPVGRYTIEIDGIKKGFEIKSNRNTLLWFIEEDKYQQLMLNKVL